MSRIVLARPAVEAGEKLGFLPGDLQEKVNPYLRPLYDALYDMLDADRVERLLERGVVEIAPLAFMRGRTLNDAFVILDEAQNTTSEQMKMFLTRLGFGSKAVITGDVTQVDLPPGKVSGLVEALRVTAGVEGVIAVLFDDRDVVRHPARAAHRQGVRSVQAADDMSRTRGVGRTGRLHVTVSDSRGRPHALARWLGPWLERHAPLAARGTVDVALLTDARMRTLNRTFRGVDRATDVLSFPAEGPAGSRPGLKSRVPSPTAPSPEPQAILGDLAIAMGVAARQARAEGHDVVTELRILALHGLLHLLGYDHERDRGTMRTVEDRLRRRAGLPAGLITRTPKRPLHK